MGRTDNTNIRILHAAVELFARKGCHGTSIKDITDKIGLTKAAFYAHVGSKGELVHRLIKEYEVRYVDELIRSVNEQEGTAVDKLHRAGSFSSEFALKNLDWLLLFENFSNELKSDPDFANSLSIVRNKFNKFIADLIRTGIRQGLLKKDLDPDIASIIYGALNRGMFQQWVLNRSLMDGEHFVRTSRMIFFKGIESQ
ncbi:MAG: TetR/AcrR family transcriptional regulator [Deltaproteobacteria bacterium]|nr:TetR/AcrR family transcriptional regulator [Deltaproteobacteria bacterium]